MLMVDGWNKLSEENEDFDEQQWEALINSDEVFTEQFSKTINTVDNSSVDINSNAVVKLSMKDWKKATFQNSDKFIYTGRSMAIIIAPSLKQRVRYANECDKIIRYVSVPNSKTMTIEIPDLRAHLVTGDTLWMRITRTTIQHRKDKLIFHHPYPIWVRHRNAKIHRGSIWIPVDDKDMDNGFLKLDTLTMIRLKQDDLAKINTLQIYSSIQLDGLDQHSVQVKNAKRIRDEYKLRQSILNFQLVRVDWNNLAYLTDCLCQTESMQEIDANEQQQITQLHDENADTFFGIDMQQII